MPKGTTVFSPYAPASVDQPARVTLARGQFLSTLDLDYDMPDDPWHPELV